MKNYFLLMLDKIKTYLTPEPAQEKKVEEKPAPPPEKAVKKVQVSQEKSIPKTPEARKKSPKKILNAIQKSEKTIRTDLNLDKWQIWQPAKSRKKGAIRIERTIKNDNGDRVEHVVEIGSVQYLDKELEVLTTDDQKTYYALIRNWEEKGKPGGNTPFSLRRIAEIKGMKWGTNQMELLKKSLRRLGRVPISWECSFYSSKKGEYLTEYTDFNVLAKLKIKERKESKTELIKGEYGYYRFDDEITENLQGNYSKPLFYETFFSLKHDTNQIFYTYFDLVMSDKNEWQRRSKELFSDVEMKGKKYQTKSGRKQRLEIMVAELDGKFISTGQLNISLGLTTDKTDYKVVLSKTAFKNLPESHQKPVKRLEKSKKVLDSQKDAKALTEHFMAKFHPFDKREVAEREIEHATTWVARHGFEKAKRMITYAHKAAQETGYVPKMFGGIMRYEADVSSDYDKEMKRNQDKNKADQLRRLYRKIQKEREKAEENAHLKLLEQHPACIEDAMKKLLKSNNFLQMQYDNKQSPRENYEKRGGFKPTVNVELQEQYPDFFQSLKKHQAQMKKIEGQIKALGENIF